MPGTEPTLSVSPPRNGVAVSRQVVDAGSLPRDETPVPPMNKTLFRLASATSALAVAGLLTLSATSADASRSRDADHDGMPNRWEARYHLGAHHANARADRDHDGLRNIAEYREGTDPTDEDTD